MALICLISSIATLNLPRVMATAALRCSVFMRAEMLSSNKTGYSSNRSWTLTKKHKQLHTDGYNSVSQPLENDNDTLMNRITLHFRWQAMDDLTMLHIASPVLCFLHSRFPRAADSVLFSIVGSHKDCQSYCATQSGRWLIDLSAVTTFLLFFIGKKLISQAVELKQVSKFSFFQAKFKAFSNNFYPGLPIPFIEYFNFAYEFVDLYIAALVILV